jgi:hypothetical protein
MKPLSQEQRAAILEQYAAYLEAELAALQPSGWPVAGLGESYAAAKAYGALIGVWEGAQIDLALADWKAAQDRKYASKKLAHMYL